MTPTTLSYSVLPPGLADAFFAGLHAAVWGVFVLAGVAMFAGAGKLVLDWQRGNSGGCFGEQRWEEIAAAWGMVVFLLAGIAGAGWSAAGPVVGGLCAVPALLGAEVGVGWLIVGFRSRRAASAAPRRAPGEEQR